MTLTLAAESTALFERARTVLPGGSTRSTLFVPPHPPYVAGGQGARVTDVDGHHLIDLQSNYTALIHGHAHPEIVDATTRAVRRGASFGLPTEAEIELAELLAERIGWASMWRFVNSGTEAVMIALRLARAATGRSAILRFDGCYHGSYDGALMPGERGVPPAISGDVISIPFDDADALRAALEARGERLACVLLDAMPNRAGLRPASREFVREVRRETSRRGILLVQDEVLTFRVALAGLHSLYGVRPDLIVLGKIIGGGLPVGAVGGPPELMGLFDPRAADHLRQAGTFAANPVTLAAGAAALRVLDADAIDHLNVLGDLLREGLRAQGWHVTGQASLARIHVSDPAALWWGAYERGYLLAGNGLICTSTPMDRELVERTIHDFAELRHLA